ncbi:MAG TPA: hypothetical protein VF988_04075 [Verrucomicrobiae bacterium]
MRKQILAGLLLLALCGCIKIKDEVTLNADGSGTVRLETHSSAPPGLAEGMSMGARMGGPDAVIYPPVSESEARKFFPEKDFKITVKQTKADNGDVTTVIEAAFTNINTLLNSAYGRAHQLSAAITNGSLMVQGVSGLEAAARFAEFKNDANPGIGMMPGLSDLQKKKAEMRAEFRIILPNAVSSTTGTNEGKSAAWIVERAKCKDAEDFAQQLGALCTAKCPAAGLTLSPVSPLRLGLLPFAQLAEGPVTAGPAIDTNQVIAAVKFTPYGLTVTRTLDLSGEGSSQQSMAQLTGAVTLPAELAPKKWSDGVLDEAVDGKGNNLKPSDSDEGRNFTTRSRYYPGMEGDADEAPATNSDVRQIVTFTFRPPDWKVSEIARVKGSVTAQYFGGSQLVKLTNAVPANWIVDPAKIAGGGFRFDSSEKNLASPALTAAGLSLSVQTAMNQGSMTMLMLQTKGKSATLTDAQVFDANGKPWPTFLLQRAFGGQDDGSCQMLIAGQPQPPLSLAFLASGSAATVTVPIVVEHVSLGK